MEIVRYSPVVLLILPEGHILIRGTLDDFSLPDVIRLIATGERSGILEVKGAAGAGRILFQGGRVLGAESTYAREPLGRKLIRLSAVSEEDVWSMLNKQGTPRTRLGQAMVEAGLVDDDQLAAALSEQIEEDVLNLLRLNPVEFVWMPGAVPAGGPGISASMLIPAVTRRLSDFLNLRRRIPSDDASVALAPLPPSASQDIHLSPSQWRLLALLGGRRVVRDLLQYSGAGDIQTLRVLADLIAAGLLEVQESETVQDTGGTWESALDSVWPPPAQEAGEGEGPRVIRLPEEGEVPPEAPAASFEIALLGAGNRMFGPLAAGWLGHLLDQRSVSIRSFGVQDLSSLPPPVEVIEAARRLGLEVAGRRTEQLRAGSLRGAELVLGWDRFDVDTAVALGGAARERTFTIFEFTGLIRGVRTPEASDLPSRARLLVARAHRARTDQPVEELGVKVGGQNDNGGPAEPAVARIRTACVIIGEALVDPGVGSKLAPPPPPPPVAPRRARS
jgi:protein-tyrosine-phosphatase